jgi:hypothetical protein
MHSLEQDGLLFIRMFDGERYHDCLVEACRRHRARTAVVLSSLGQFSAFELGFFVGPGDYAPRRFDQPHELIAVSGLLSAAEPQPDLHLHAALGDRDRRTVSGHLLWAEVAVTNETVLLTSRAALARRLDPATGLRQLVLP